VEEGERFTWQGAFRHSGVLRAGDIWQKNSPPILYNRLHMREKLNFDYGWLFHLGDIESPLPNTHVAAYMNHKAGWSRGAARVNYDDSDWRRLKLPHDWSVEGKFDPSNHLSAGFLPRGVGWYRRHFALDESDRGRRISITFDGVATHCTVYVNGHLLHRHFCGYTPFTIDISDVAQYGETLNVVAVRVDATFAEGWWYEGAGIYRHVWLTKTSPIHVPDGGVFVAPRPLQRKLWTAAIETTVHNSLPAVTSIEVLSEIIAPDGTIVAQVARELSIPSRRAQALQTAVDVRSPALWSIDSPSLYTLRTTLNHAGESLDCVETTFGFRTIRFDAKEGFFLNDQPVKILGTCNHQDHAGLGVALPDSIHAFRIQKLKESGCNAYRAAHHPPAKELLDACDRLGMLVMDENRAFGSSPQHMSQLRSMVLRDRNHPSIILWSICNEESIQTSPVSKQIAETMVAEVKRLDPTRPVTAAVSGGVLNDGCIGDALDVMCINYQLPTHDAYHEKFPAKPLIAGETHCMVSTRGVYTTDESACHLAADDSEKHPWGETARETWRFVSTRPYVAGLFVWTGFDYRGEPMPGRWPCVNSQMGFLDACGFEKDSFYLHQAWWSNQPMVHLLGHWNRRPGEMVELKVYTNCDEAEVLLNDRSLGRQRVDPIEMATWRIPFVPGLLTAKGYIAGELAAMQEEVTTGPASELIVLPMLHARASTVPADGQLALPILVAALDDERNPVPTAGDYVRFTISGPAVLLGTGNGDPKCHEPDKASARSLFNGIAQLIVQTTREPGEITITATAEGLKPSKLVLQSVAPAALPPIVEPVQKRHLLADWRVSPVTPDRPDPNQAIAAADMNSWERITLGTAGGHSVTQAGYVIYRTTFTPPKSMQETGGRILISGIKGPAEVLIDATEVSPAPARDGSRDGAMAVPFPPTAEKLSISILVHIAGPGNVFAGPVELFSV